jgi:hypothetical protein
MNQSLFIENFLLQHFHFFENKLIYYLCMLGNDDMSYLDEKFDKICRGFKFIYNMGTVYGDNVNLGRLCYGVKGYSFIGYNNVPDHPFGLKDRSRRDLSDTKPILQWSSPILSTKEGFENIDNLEEYLQKLPTVEEELASRTLSADMEKTVFIIHTPPAFVELDKCRNGREVGSRAVYNFIKEKQPLLSFHGHIHEQAERNIYTARIDKTLVFQPGQSKKEFIYVVYDTETKNYKRTRV